MWETQNWIGEVWEADAISWKRIYDPTISSPIRCDSHRNWGEAADFVQMQEEAAQIADVSRVSTDEVGPQSLRPGNGKAPKMPHFDEERDLKDSYLGRFEKFATCLLYTSDAADE